MKASQVVGAAFASLVAWCACSREPQLAGLRSYSLPGYTLLAPDAATAQLVATHAATIERVLAVVLNRQPASAAIPTTVIMIRGADLERYVGNESRAGTELLPRSFHNYLLLRSDGSRDLLRAAVYHQFAHLYLHTQFHDEFPWWFDEGFALFMEATRFEGPEAIVGNARFGFREIPRVSDPLDQFKKEDHPLEPNPNSQGRGVPEWTALETVLRYREGTQPGETRDSLYLFRRQSWAMVHRALVGEPDFGNQVFAYLQAINQFVPIEEAVPRSFGMSTPELDKNLRAYAMREKFKTMRKTFNAPAPVAVEAGQPVSDAAALQTFASLLLDDGTSRNVDEAIAAAAKLAPDSTEVNVLRMRLAALKGDGVTLERLLTAMETRSTDVAAARGAGLALFEWIAFEQARKPASAAGVPRVHERALNLLDRALQAKPDDAEAAWAYAGLAAGTNTSLDTALERLRLASERSPQNADLAMAMAHVYEARNEPAKMLEQLENTARFTRSIEQRRWAVERIDAAKAAQQKSP
jgi:hypothetical protein